MSKRNFLLLPSLSDPTLQPLLFAGNSKDERRLTVLGTPLSFNFNSDKVRRMSYTDVYNLYSFTTFSDTHG